MPRAWCNGIDCGAYLGHQVFERGGTLVAVGPLGVGGTQKITRCLDFAKLGAHKAANNHASHPVRQQTRLFDAGDNAGAVQLHAQRRVLVGVLVGLAQEFGPSPIAAGFGGGLPWT